MLRFEPFRHHCMLCVSIRFDWIQYCWCVGFPAVSVIVPPLRMDSRSKFVHSVGSGIIPHTCPGRRRNSGSIFDATRAMYGLSCCVVYFIKTGTQTRKIQKLSEMTIICVCMYGPFVPLFDLQAATNTKHSVPLLRPSKVRYCTVFVHSTHVKSLQIGDDQLEHLQSIRNKPSLAGQSSLLRRSIALVKSLSCPLRGQRDALLHRLGNVFGNETGLYIITISILLLLLLLQWRLDKSHGGNTGHRDKPAPQRALGKIAYRVHRLEFDITVMMTMTMLMLYSL